METFGETTYQTVLNTIHKWPLDKRVALVQDVLGSLAMEVAPQRRKPNSLQAALGLLATDQAAPSDREIERWLQEHRMEKYG